MVVVLNPEGRSPQFDRAHTLEADDEILEGGDDKVDFNSG
jgi:hypothetical protein